MTDANATEGSAAASRRAALRQLALGETGFERATVWSAVGFALTYVAFDATAAAGVGPAPTAGGLAAVAAAGAIAFAATGGGALPTALLAYGPFAGTVLRALGPTPYAVPGGSGGPPLDAVTAPLALAAAVAVAAGFAAAVVGFLVGRLRE